MISPEELTAIKARAEAATPGPRRVWRCTDEDCYVAPHWDIYQPYSHNEEAGEGIADVCASRSDPTVGEADAEFIANARTDIPTLVEEVERLHAKLQAIQTIVDTQAADAGLWCYAGSIVEAYIQQELRRLHTAIETGTV